MDAPTSGIANEYHPALPYAFGAETTPAVARDRLNAIPPKIGNRGEGRQGGMLDKGDILKIECGIIPEDVLEYIQGVRLKMPARPLSSLRASEFYNYE